MEALPMELAFERKETNSKYVACQGSAEHPGLLAGSRAAAENEDQRGQAEGLPVEKT